MDVGFIGRLGNDDFGKFLIKILEENHVKVLLTGLLEGAVTTIYDEGERSFTFVRKPGSDTLLNRSDIKKEDIKSCKVLHAGSYVS